MKIVIATAVYYPMTNGVATFSYQLARGLTARGHDVLVLCPSQNKEAHSVIEHFGAGSLTTTYLKSTELKFYPDQVHSTIPSADAKRSKFGLRRYEHGVRISLLPNFAIKKALDDFKPDVVHIQTADPIGNAVDRYAHKHYIPIVATEHNQPEVIFGSFAMAPRLRSALYTMMSRSFINRLNRADFATMPTTSAIQHLVTNAKQPATDGATFAVPIAAVSNGVNLANFRPGVVPPDIYAKYHIPRDTPLVLYVGRLDAEKKVDQLIRAFNDIALNQTSTAVAPPHLIITGDGTARSDLEKLTSQLQNPRIHLIGAVTPPDLYDVYRTGTVFATMSPVETQGVVLVEAAASGLPLVAVNAGAVGEICQNQVNGFLVGPDDTTAMAQALQQLLMDASLRQQFAQNSLNIAATHDFATTLARFENIYHQAVMLHGAPAQAGAPAQPPAETPQTDAQAQPTAETPQPDTQTQPPANTSVQTDTQTPEA